MFDNKSIILKFNILILTISVIIICFLIPNSYTTKISFISPSADMISNYSEPLSLSTTQVNLKSGALSLKDPSQIYVEILKSRHIRLKVLEKINLKEYYKNIKDEDEEEFLDNKVTVKVNSGLIEIYTETNNPQLSYKISKEYLEIIAKLLNDINVAQAKDSSIFIEKRLKNTTEKLSQVSTKLVNFQLKNSMVDVKKQSEALVDIISSLEKKILTLEAQLNSLTIFYKESSPKVLAIKAEINKMKSQVKSLTDKNINRTNKSDENPSVYDIPGLNNGYTNISRDLKTLEEVFGVLIKEYEMSKIKQAKDNLVLKVIDEPYIPIKKSGPKRLLLLFSLMFISFSLSILALIIKFRINELINNLSENNHSVNLLLLKLKIIKDIK